MREERQIGSLGFWGLRNDTVVSSLGFPIAFHVSQKGCCNSFHTGTTKRHICKNFHEHLAHCPKDWEDCGEEEQKNVWQYLTQTKQQWKKTPAFSVVFVKSNEELSFHPKALPHGTVGSQCSDSLTQRCVKDPNKEEHELKCERRNKSTVTVRSFSTPP